MRATLTTVTVAAAVVLAACSTATSGAPHHVTRLSPAAHTTAASAPHASRSAPASPYPSATPTAAPTSASSGASDVDRALLVASDLGAEFAAAEPDKPATLPCTPNRPPVDDQVRHVEKGNAVFVDDIAGEQVSEQIYVYGSTGDALRHENILEAGLGCRHGVLAGSAVTVLGPSDVRRQLSQRPDSAKVWIIRTDQVTGALVAVRLHAVMVQFAVVAQNGDEADLDVRKVVQAGLTKILAVANG